MTALRIEFGALLECIECGKPVTDKDRLGMAIPTCSSCVPDLDADPGRLLKGAE